MEKFYVQQDGFSRVLIHDYEGVMTKIAKLGYSGIEIFYGLHGGYTPQGLKDFLASIGMTVIGSHVELKDMDEQLKYLPGTGCRYIICPGIHVGGVEEAKRAAEDFNEWGRKAKSVGMKFGYHNHNNDFNTYDGQMINDIFIEYTDPDLVAFEIDVAWAWRAGVPAAGYIRKHPGRFELVHVKETILTEGGFAPPPRPAGAKPMRMERGPDGWPVLDEEGEKWMEQGLSINCELGKGVINMHDIKDAVDAQGIETNYVVERDYAWTGDIFTTLAHDAGYLRCL